MSIACSAGKQSRVLATLLYGAGEDWLNACPNSSPPEKNAHGLTWSTQLWASTQLVLVCGVLGASVVQGRSAPECQQYFCGCGTCVGASWTCARVLDGGADEDPPLSSVVVE